MNDKVLEARRALFEDWYERYTAQGWSVSRMATWLAFNAALDAVEIELPVSEIEGCHGVKLVCFPNDVIAAIESTNLGLRVK